MTDKAIKKPEDNCVIESKEQSDEKFQITGIWILHKERISSKKWYPYVLLSRSFMEPSESELEELKIGEWSALHYDYHEGTYSSTKVADIRSIISGIRIEYIKKTESRGTEESGTNEKVIKGAYEYPIPPDMLEEIAQDYYAVCTKLHYGKPDPISEALKDKIIKRLAGNLY